MKVSIITINYNNAEGLERTIKSIAAQGPGDFEYLIIDGNSTDRSVDVIKDNEQCIDYWVSEPDSGIYNAMNKGIKQARGAYVIFINSGDTIQSNISLHEKISCIEGHDITYFNMEIMNPDNGVSYIKKYPENLDFKYFAGDTLPHHASFIRRQMLLDYGFYSENYKIVSDWAFFMDSVCLNKCTYKYIDGCFSTFYLDGISSQPSTWQLLLEERNKHISTTYPLYKTIYHEWVDNREELYRLKNSFSVKTLKKIGFLRWLK